MQNEMRLELKKLLEGSLEVDPGTAVMLELMSTNFPVRVWFLSVYLQ